MVAIAAIIALGSGTYAGLASTSAWRRQSLNATFARLSAHDVDVTAASGFSAPEDRLLGAVRTAGGSAVAVAEARLVADLPLRAGPAGSIPAAGVVVGVDLASPVAVDRWAVTAGKPIGPAGSDGDAVLLDEHFTRAHHLPSSGTVDIAGTPVRYVGTALDPEYLNTTTTFGATIQGAATRAIVYAPLSLVQRLAGHPGQANDVAVLVRHGTDAGAVADRLSRRLPAVLPGVPVTVTARQDDPDVQALYGEISSEQDIFNVFALLILAGAGFAAFNLTRRVVEAQRRDIGIAMALGVRSWQIAIRPVVMAAEVAVAGVLLGVVVGWGLGEWVLTVIQRQEPLPVWQTPWQGGLFLVAAALALLIPLAGSAFPTWRAVRVVPTDALLPPHLRGQRHRLSSLLRRVRLPGTTLMQAPVRRVTIAPTRSAMTVLAVGLILAPLLAALATTDSTTATIDTGSRILSGRGSDRLLVDLTSYQPASSGVVSSITGSPLVARHAVGLDTGGYLVRDGTTVGVSINMVDLSDPLVAPPGLVHRSVRSGGIVISTKAAADLGVHAGQRVQLRHPFQEGVGFRFVDTTLPVRAVIDSPYRFIAYMDIDDEPVMGLHGIVNTATLVPRRGVPMGHLQRTISSMPGVAWALPAAALSDTIRDVLSLVTDLFVVLQIVIGLLAFLVAYNSTRIASDERARENATMMAFGVPIPRIVLAGVGESLVLGIVGVGVGIGVGIGVFHWVLDTVFPAAVPELSVLPDVTAWSFLITAIIGLAATAAAPTLIVRQLRRMDVPSTLRYVE